MLEIMIPDDTHADFPARRLRNRSRAGGRALLALGARLAGLALFFAMSGPGAAQVPDELARFEAARSVEGCESVVMVRCAHPGARDPSQALHQERVQERRRQSRRKETNYDGPEFDEIEILADRIAGVREERWQRFGGDIAESHRPGCLTNEALIPEAGLFSIPIWAFFVVTGHCR
jgi:hypothetical protein